MVPFFTEAQTSKDRNAFKILRSNVFTIVFVGLLLITGIFYYFSAELINIFAFGFDESTKELSANLLKRMSPFLFLISLSALNMGLLNSAQKFNAPAFSPVLMNVGIILIVLISSFYFSLSIYVLSYAVLFGALLQYLFQIPFIFRNNLSYNLNFNQCINTKTKEIFKVIFPQIFGLAVYNINILVNTQFASFLEKGSITYLYLAERLIEFPLGIFAVSVATTVLPVLSTQYLKKNYCDFSRTINEKLKFLLFLSAPFVLAFIFIGQDICNVLYARGEFTVSDSYMTYKALLAYSFGLIFVAGVRLVTQGFYATKNTKLPVIFGAYNLGVNFLLCYILGFYFNLGFFGLALASSISSIFLFCILIFKLKTLIDGIKILDFFKYLILILTISGASLFLGLRTSEFITQGNSLSFGLITTILSSAIFFIRFTIFVFSIYYINNLKLYYSTRMV